MIDLMLLTRAFLLLEGADSSDCVGENSTANADHPNAATLSLQLSALLSGPNVELLFQYESETFWKGRVAPIRFIQTTFGFLVRQGAGFVLPLQGLTSAPAIMSVREAFMPLSQARSSER